MPLDPASKLFAVSDAKIAKLLTDPVTPPATYGTLIDVPGIKTVGIGFEMKTVELRGDNKQLDSDTTLIGVNLAFSHAKVSFDALPVLIGGTTTYSGSTPAMKAQYRRLGADVFSYFKFEARTPTSGVDSVGGDAHIVIYKAKVTDYSLGLAEEDYQEFSGTARGVARVADDFLWDLIENETQLAIT